MTGKQTIDQDLLKTWLYSLKSGEYVQGVGGLSYLDHCGDMVYCVLGVLCNIANPTLWNEPNEDGVRSYGPRMGTYPPEDLLKRVGLTKTDAYRLATLNDKRRMK